MIAVMIAIAALAQDAVTLRGGEGAPPLMDKVVAVDLAGVHIGSDPKVATLIVPWDRVRAFAGSEPQRAEFGPLADTAWRARTRLERGDFVSAEPLFERLFEQYRTQAVGGTGAVVAEGLLRCRLRRGAHVAAVEAWLSAIRAAGATRTPVLHADWASEAGLAPVIDSASGLVPAVPPIWLAWPSVDAMARSEPPARSGDAKADALAQIYVQAARFEAGLPARLADPASSDAGVNLAWQVVIARIGQPEQRELGRRLLQDRLGPSPSTGPPAAWAEAWCRAGIGRSLLREDAKEKKQLGVVELLNIPARFSRSHPYLAGMALAEASVALREMGDAEGADVLARELIAMYPTHPVLDWPPIREAAAVPPMIQSPPNPGTP